MDRSPLSTNGPSLRRMSSLYGTMGARVQSLNFSPADATQNLTNLSGQCSGNPERIKTLIHSTSRELSISIANDIAKLIRSKQQAGLPCVLGCPTGSTPISIYRELIRMHKEEKLDFSNVITFNLDEYYPMKSDSIQSYHRFMYENFFNHINILPQNIHIPNGNISVNEISTMCEEYETKINNVGGIDLCLLGIGRTGHIGFNEPGSEHDSKTRLVVLDDITRKDAASDFYGLSNVPLQAITMGIGSILSSRKIYIIATGEKKGLIVKRAIEELPSKDVMASFLQYHTNVIFHLDHAASAFLTKICTPWLIHAPNIIWDDTLTIKAVLWLSRKLDKPIFCLDIEDFHSHCLHDLIYKYNGVDEVVSFVFENINNRIYSRPKEHLFSKSRVLILSPHPDDDVICVGGLIQYLKDNDNIIHTAYCTSGSIAVFDCDTEQYLRWAISSSEIFGFNNNNLENQYVNNLNNLLNELDNKKPGEPDTVPIQKLKGNIRASEAINALHILGLSSETAHFLEMPFYSTGVVKKNPITNNDIQIIRQLLDEIHPHHIFVAGDWSDPHGTHRMVYSAIRSALIDYIKDVKEDDMNDMKACHVQHKRHVEGIATVTNPQIWLYRGSWIEYEVQDTDVFIPLTKSVMNRKLLAIYKHKSQKDKAAFPGVDPREFSERARIRNLNSAESLDNYGFPKFWGIECFRLTSVKDMEE